MTDPYVHDPDFTLHVGDALEVLQGLPSESVHMCVTSPPFFGLRDYGTGTWEGGNPDCDHTPPKQKERKFTNGRGEGGGDGYAGSNLKSWTDRDGTAYGQTCGKCGARRVDRQIGLEASPDEWVARLVDVFREVRRVLRRDGVMFVEVGDSYASSALRGGASRGTTYTPRSDSQEPGFECPDLRDGSEGAQSSRNQHSDQLPRGVSSPDDAIGRSSESQDSAGASERAPHGAQESTSYDDARAPREGSTFDDDGDLPGTPALPPCSSSPDAPGTARTTACNDGTAQTQLSSADRIRDKEPSALALLLQTIAARPVGAKQLMGMPWLLALALQCDGWILRSDIVFARPNPMPESVRDRPTKSHSYLFMFSREPRYFFDQEAVREPMMPESEARYGYAFGGKKAEELAEADRNGMGVRTRTIGMRESNGGRNIRSVWTIPTEPLPDEHYAAYPQKLVERCILAGSSERGCCPDCGAPWERVVERTPMQIPERVQAPRVGSEATSLVNDGERRRAMNGQEWAKSAKTETLGWRPSCNCTWPGAVVPREPIPCMVLDPFLGSGTTALVARRLGRHTIGIELSPTYAAMAARRLQQLSLLA